MLEGEGVAVAVAAAAVTVCGMANQSVRGNTHRALMVCKMSRVSRRGGKREKFDVTYAASSGHCAPFIPLLPLALGACY